MNPSNPEMKGNSEVYIDGQTPAEKKEQFEHANKECETESSEDRGRKEEAEKDEEEGEKEGEGM